MIDNNRFCGDSNPPSSTNNAKGHLRVAFCIIGGVGADEKQRVGFSRSLRSKRRQRPQGGKSPTTSGWPFALLVELVRTRSNVWGSAGACVASGDNARRAVNPPPGGLLHYW